MGGRDSDDDRPIPKEINRKKQGKEAMANEQPKIVSITACAVPGKERTFTNVYGLDDRSRVWQWNARDGRWAPHKVQPKNDGGSF